MLNQESDEDIIEELMKLGLTELAEEWRMAILYGPLRLIDNGDQEKGN